MDLLAVLNLLWARRLAVGFGVLVAIAAGLRAMPRRSVPTGSAVTARLLVDTTPSAIVSAGPGNAGALADPLPARAALLAEVMATDEFQKLLASQAHVQADQLDVLPPSSSTFPVDALITQKTAALAADAPGPYVLRLQADEQTPLISIEADAPGAVAAARLAAAAITVLNSPLASQQTGEGPPVLVRTVAPPRGVEPAIHAGRRAVAVLVSFAVFALWCGGIVLVSGRIRAMRRAVTM